MTENQSDYLADLAGRKGVRLFDTDNWSVSKASEEIETLKELPEAQFNELNDKEISKIDSLTENVLVQLRRWGFERREG